MIYFFVVILFLLLFAYWQIRKQSLIDNLVEVGDYGAPGHCPSCEKAVDFSPGDYLAGNLEIHIFTCNHCRSRLKANGSDCQEFFRSQNIHSNVRYIQVAQPSSNTTQPPD
jgi:predicted amidophosphoribosyltransferase